MTMRPTNDSPIFLIGYRGTGKTTLGRRLAARLGYDSIDADDQIEQRAGQTIAQIFATEGAEAFRELESQVVAELCERRSVVVALGGGAVLREGNRAAIESVGPVVWLTASVEAIHQRVAADEATGSRRPNLTNMDSRSEIEALLAERTPIYRECATFEVDTEGKTPDAIVDEIVRRLAEHPADDS